MRRITELILFTLVGMMLLAIPALADTLFLKNGDRVAGYFEGGSARMVRFRGPDGLLRDYDIVSVQRLQFGDDPIPAAAAQKPAQPALVPGNTRTQAAAPPASATSKWTVPTGSKIVIRTIDSIDSEKKKVGETFVATLDEAIIVNGYELVPRNSDVRGRISNVNEAGRVAGAAELRLELTQVVVNGVPYSLTTSEYQEVGEGRGEQTAKRAGVGGGIGAIVGAIAGGKKGAVVGAGVGAGGATAVQALTKGEKLLIPSETKLEFTLKAPLVIARS